MRVLIIEDDAVIAGYAARALGADGWSAVIVTTLAEGIGRAAAEPFDLVVLDRMLPDGDGLLVVKGLRERQITTPVLVLSALGDLPDRLSGLDEGADDYLVKPFAGEELAARARAIVRRAQQGPHPSIRLVGDIEIHQKGRQVYRQGRLVPLSAKEFEIIAYFADHQGETVTRKMLLKDIWGVAREIDSNVVDVTVNRLRRKLEAGFATPVLATIRKARAGAARAAGAPSGWRFRGSP
jgi:two-component system, OmpR family, response regulator